MLRSKFKLRPRLAWAIVMANGAIDEISFEKKHLHALDGEHIVRVQISRVRPKNGWKKTNG